MLASNTDRITAAINFIALSLASCSTSMRCRSPTALAPSRDRSLKLPSAAIWRGAPLPVHLVVHPALAPRTRRSWSLSRRCRSPGFSLGRACTAILKERRGEFSRGGIERSRLRRRRGVERAVDKRRVSRLVTFLVSLETVGFSRAAFMLRFGDRHRWSEDAPGKGRRLMEKFAEPTGLETGCSSVAGG
jgi:hypothetical protein